MNRRVDIKTIKHGQQGAYSDHEYLYELIFSQKDYHTNVPPETMVPWYPDEKTALTFARAACPWVDKDDPKHNWASRTFISFDRLDPTLYKSQKFGVAEGYSDRWLIHVRSAYTD